MQVIVCVGIVARMCLGCAHWVRRTPAKKTKLSLLDGVAPLRNVEPNKNQKLFRGWARKKGEGAQDANLGRNDADLYRVMEARHFRLALDCVHRPLRWPTPECLHPVAP
jgi:hypothetical protein